jgi:RNA polymerase sigma-70 factor (ECF subfamily)
MTRAEDIFNILIRQHAEMLSAFIHAYAFDRSAVDDIFQETVLTAWRRLDEFDASRPFGPWLRGNRRYRAHLDELQNRRVSEQFGRLESTAGDTFADRLEALRDCISRLAPDAREAVELVYAQQLDSSVAAESAGTNDETFRKRLYRARLSLAACLRSKRVLDELPEPSP